MSAPHDRTLSRRRLLTAALGGAAAAPLFAAVGCTPATPTAHRTREAAMSSTSPAGRQPVVYLPHGGGPWPFVEGLGDPNELGALAAYLRALPRVGPAAPRAVVMVTAHWEEAVPTVSAAARPPMLYDYYGFPAEAYQVTWAAPGDPALAARVRALLSAAGIASAASPDRGFDHGTFVPMKVAWPEANIPTVQLSLQQGLDPAAHLALGRALAPLRDEGVLVVGSGMSYHNLRAFFRDRAEATAASAAFDAWLAETVARDPADRAARLRAWADAPAARRAHPREEHLLPLMVIAGAAGDDLGRVAWQGQLMGSRISAHHFG